MAAAFPAVFLEDLIDDCVTFPEMKGFSISNLKYMRFFAQQCPSGLIGQQPADQLPWFHLVTLLTKVSAEAEREWYAAQAIAQGWSRLTLDIHIKNRLHLRQAAAVTNRLIRRQNRVALMPDRRSETGLRGQFHRNPRRTHFESTADIFGRRVV
jgi:predicted nuclease of restriction endonuclease-like (RecB) superfamily